MSTVGGNLKRIREDRGHSQRSVGLALGHTSGGYIAAVEHGKKHPNPETLDKIAAFLGCTEEDLTQPCSRA